MSISKKIFFGGFLALLLLASHVYAVPAGKNVTFTFNLQKGWNLISLPVLTSFTADSFGSFVGSDVKYIITAFNATTKAQKIYVSEVSGEEDDFEIKPDFGYFVFVTSDCKFTVTGQSAGIRNVPLYKGLNLVGWTSFDKSTAADAFVTPLGSNLINVSKRNSDGSFQTFTFNVSQNADNFAVEPGSGYLLYVERDCILSYGREGGPAGELLQEETVEKTAVETPLNKPVSGRSVVMGFEAGIAIAVLLAAFVIKKIRSK